MNKSITKKLKEHSFITSTSNHKKRRVVPLNKVFKILKENTQQIKKDSSEGANNNYLETQSKAGEGENKSIKPVHLSCAKYVDNQSAENLNNSEEKCH